MALGEYPPTECAAESSAERCKTVETPVIEPSPWHIRGLAQYLRSALHKMAALTAQNKNAETSTMHAHCPPCFARLPRSVAYPGAPS